MSTAAAGVVDLFCELAAISSPSRHERAVADRVLELLRGLGLEPVEDDAGGRIGSDIGNIYCRLAPHDGGGGTPIFLNAHLDTVPPDGPVEPEVRNGIVVNRRDTILGADNKAAVAVMLELGRRFARESEPPDVGLELLFTVSEENGLHGAKAFDVSRLGSQFGFVFDHSSPIGEIIVASPTYNRLTADLHGRAAHAGIRPEIGRSAIEAAARGIASMRLGRLDPETTANVGTISGGTATNVVPERCRIEAEVRGIAEQRVEEVLTDMVDRFQDAADGAECDLDVTIERMFRGYRIKPSAPQLELAERALSACGYQARQIVTGGGSDANAFEASGFPCLNLANGTERNHEPDERVSADALEGMLEVAITLVEDAASP